MAKQALEHSVYDKDEERSEPLSRPAVVSHPQVFKQTPQTYRTYENAAWRYFKKGAQWAMVCLGLYWLCYPRAQSAVLEGKIVAQETRVVDAKLSGEIIAISKKMGDTVKKDDVIATVQNDAMCRQQKCLSAEQEIIQTRIAGCTGTLAVEKKRYENMRALFKAGAIDELQLQEHELRVKRLEGEKAVLAAQLAENAVKRSNIESEIAAGTVRSAYDGVITSPIEEKLNASIQSGEPLCEVAYGGHFLEFQAREDMVSSIETGQELTIRMSAFPELLLRGRVVQVKPIVFEDTSKPWKNSNNAHVIVALESSLPQRVRFGMSAETTIQLKRREPNVVKWVKELALQIKQ